MIPSLSVLQEEYATVMLADDMAVPIYNVPKALAAFEDISNQYDIHIPAYGHAGDGNLHVNLLSDDADAEEAARRFHAARVDLFHHTLHLGGTLSGEHGIGLAKRDFMILEHGPQELEMMRAIKKLWDPLGLLNPGKLLPAPY